MALREHAGVLKDYYGSLSLEGVILFYSSPLFFPQNDE
jgi:hypothetical protein